MKHFIIFKVLLIVLIIAAMIFLIDISFIMMDCQSTVLFILGILLFVLTIGLPIEIAIRKYLLSHKKRK